MLEKAGGRKIMSEITISKIEEILLKKKEKELTEKVTNAAYQFIDTVNQYIPLIPTNDKDKNNCHEWVKDMFVYSWKIFIDDVKISEIPDCIREQLFKDAVEEFIQSVESTRDRLNELQES